MKLDFTDEGSSDYNIQQTSDFILPTSGTDQAVYILAEVQQVFELTENQFSEECVESEWYYIRKNLVRTVITSIAALGVIIFAALAWLAFG